MASHPEQQVGRRTAGGPERFDDCFDDPKRTHLRKQARRAFRAGFTVALLHDPPARFDEFMAINRSAAVRQGQPMHPAYFDEAIVRRYLERTADVFAVSDATGVVRGYFCFRMCGPVACGERVLGHADFLDKGIMYVLLAEVVRELCGRRQDLGRPVWMYDDMSP